MMRRAGMGFLVVAACGLGYSLAGGETKPAEKLRRPPEAALMRAKVASTQKIMEGLVAKDFAEIHSGAEELKRICRATEWEAHADPQYAFHRAELCRQADKLMFAADQSNLEAAAFNYLNALTNCINCHDHCRDVLKIATIKRPTKVIPIPTTDADDAPSIEKTIRR